MSKKKKILREIRCPACGTKFMTKASKLAKCRNKKCGVRVLINPDNIVGDPSEGVRPDPAEGSGEGSGSFWDLIRSRRQDDKDILDTIGEITVPPSGEDEDKKIIVDGTGPLTSTETNVLIGELMNAGLKQIAHLMDTENNDPISDDERSSLLGKSAVLCLNIQIKEPEGDPIEVSPITMLVVVVVVCFLPQLWDIGRKGNWLDKLPFVRKKEENGDGKVDADGEI